MKKKLIHTPEGVRDIYNGECRQKLALQKQLLSVLDLYGYQPIETPGFEFLDVFSKDKGSVSDREMFKFFDRDNNTLVLRPDMTPAIARCSAKYFMDETMPLRLCYLERMYINNTSYQGRFKESTQTGAELIGDDSSDADAEMIALAIDCLKSLGLKEFQLELGHIDFYYGILEESGLEEELLEDLQGYIENKNFFALEELLKNSAIDEKMKQVLLALPEFCGSAEQIHKARRFVTNKRSIFALDRLERVYEILAGYGLSEYVSFDLGMLSKYRYYTGIIYKAYTYGTGDYIITGGRYDKLLKQFGKDSPAIGFAIVIDRLLMALNAQQLFLPVKETGSLIAFDVTARYPAIALAKHFRAQNMAVQFQRRHADMPIEEYLKMALKRGIRNLLYVFGDGRRVRVYDTGKGTYHELDMSDYLGKNEV